MTYKESKDQYGGKPHDRGEKKNKEEYKFGGYDRVYNQSIEIDSAIEREAEQGGGDNNRRDKTKKEMQRRHEVQVGTETNKQIRSVLRLRGWIEERCLLQQPLPPSTSPYPLLLLHAHIFPAP